GERGWGRDKESTKARTLPQPTSPIPSHKNPTQRIATPSVETAVTIALIASKNDSSPNFISLDSSPSETARAPCGISTRHVTITTGANGGVLKKIATGLAMRLATPKHVSPIRTAIVFSCAICSWLMSRSVMIARGNPNPITYFKKGNKKTRHTPDAEVRWRQQPRHYH